MTADLGHVALPAPELQLAPAQACPAGTPGALPTLHFTLCSGKGGIASGIFFTLLLAELPT